MYAKTPSTSDLSFPSSPTTVFAPFSQSKLGGPVENPRFVSWSNACRRSPLLKNRRVRGRRTPCDGAGVGVSVPALRDSGWHRAGTPPVPCPANRLARRNRRCSPGSSDLFFDMSSCGRGHPEHPRRPAWPRQSGTRYSRLQPPSLEASLLILSHRRAARGVGGTRTPSRLTRAGEVQPGEAGRRLHAADGRGGREDARGTVQAAATGGRKHRDETMPGNALQRSQHDRDVGLNVGPGRCGTGSLELSVSYSKPCTSGDGPDAAGEAVRKEAA